MSLNSKTALIIVFIILSLLYVGLFPSANSFTIVSIFGSGLIIFLMYMILKDDYTPSEGHTGPAPGYRRD